MPGESITIGIVVSEGNPDNTISNTLLEQRNEGQGGLTQEPIPTPTPSPDEEIVITIDTSVMEKHPNVEMYMVDVKLEELTGELTASEKVEMLSFVTEDMNGTVVDSGELSAASDWVIEEPGLVIGANKLTIIAEAKETDNITTNKTYSTEIYIMNFSQENMDAADVDLADTDGDGINNYTESIFGTDPDSGHSDEDGIGDLQEITLTGTDPLKTDTDENGIPDNEEDFEEDGLTAEEELEAGTQIFFADSDGDGLGDGEEVKNYGTDPMDEDTDDDTLTDGQEIELGTDPLSPDSDNDGIKDSEEITPQTYTEEIDTTERNEITKVSVTMDSAGHIENEMYILDTYNLDMRSTEVVGLIGVPVDITSNQEFDNATITFHYDEAALTTTEDNLGILWYDEENDKYILVEDVVLDAENNTISCETDHFSTWLVVNKEQWKQCWANAVFDPTPISISTYPSYTVKLEDGDHRYQMFDGGAGSIAWSEAAQRCKLAGGHLAIIETDEESRALVNYVTGALEVGSVVGFYKPMSSYGILPAKWTVIDESHVMGKQGNPPKYYGVQYFICEWELGEDGALAEDTTTDTDGDGLPDYYEKKGFLLSNGTVVYTKPDKADSDNDGISDYDEVGGLPVPETFDIDGITYNVMVNYPAGYHKLSEEFIYVDGRVNANGMVIDSKMEYVPYSNEFKNELYNWPLDGGYSPDVFDRSRVTYGAVGTHGLYADKLEKMTQEELDGYLHWNNLLLYGSTLASMDINAYNCLNRYIKGTGGRSEGLDERGTREYMWAGYLFLGNKFKTNSINKCWQQNLNKVVKVSEMVLNDNNREIYISLSPNCVMDGCSYAETGDGVSFKEGIASLANISAFGIFNVSKSGITVHCIYNVEEQTYSMNYIYYLTDFYDFTPLNQLHEQDALGLARSYELYGYVEGSVEWKKGDNDIDYKWKLPVE